MAAPINLSKKYFEGNTGGFKWRSLLACLLHDFVGSSSHGMPLEKAFSSRNVSVPLRLRPFSPTIFPLVSSGSCRSRDQRRSRPGNESVFCFLSPGHSTDHSFRCQSSSLLLLLSLRCDPNKGGPPEGGVPFDVVGLWLVQLIHFSVIWRGFITDRDIRVVGVDHSVV